MNTDISTWEPLNHQRFKQQLILHEARRAKPYQDSRGIWTCGIGHNMMTRWDDVTIDCVFANDVKIVERALDDGLGRWWRQIGDVRMRVLADLMFNLGAPTFFTFTTFIALVTSGDYAAAADDLTTTKWFTQVGERGPRLVAMMRTGEDFK